MRSRQFVCLVVGSVLTFAASPCLSAEPPTAQKGREAADVPLAGVSIHEAAQAGDIEKVKALLVQGIDVNGKDSRGLTLLHVASLSGHEELVRFLINRGADVSAKADGGQKATPLHMAAAMGHKGVVEILLARGADINVQRHGQAPLSLAVVTGNKDMVEFLLSNQAEVTASVLGTAKKSGRKELLDTLLANKDSADILLLKAAEEGNQEFVRSALDHGADINVKDSFGLTPLHHAAANGNEEMVGVLLEHSAAVDVEDNAGRRPLHYAAGASTTLTATSSEEPFLVIVGLLLDNGADINAQDSSGWTPLHYSTLKFKKDLIKLLIERGADLNAVDEKGRTPYLFARDGNLYHESISDSKWRHYYADGYADIVALLRNDHWYVSTEGEDTSAGTFKAPLRTIHAAVNRAEPNDVIIVRGGIYRWERAVNLGRSGEEGRPITLESYPGEAVIFDFSSVSELPMTIRGSYWHLKRLTVVNGDRCGIRINGSSAHHNILEQIAAYENATAGIIIEKDAACNIVVNCDAYKNCDFHFNGECGDGIELNWFVGRDNILMGNRAWNNSDDGFDTWRAGNPVRFESCYAWRNGENIWDHPFFVGNGNGFKLGRGEGRHTLINCCAWGHWDRGFNLNGNESGIFLYNCSAWSNGNNYDCGWVGWPEEGRRNTILTNGISYNVRGRDSIDPQAQSESNSWDLDLCLTDGDFLSLDDSQMSAPRNPDGSIPYNNFLRLAPNSAAIDAGVDVNMPYTGTAPDLGAFEYDPNENPENYVKMLHQYVRDHDTKKINELLAAGTSINEKDWLGYAPLHWACYFGYADLAELLIGKGADPSLVSDTGRTPVEIATSMQYDNIADLLRQYGAKK
jgi:ankyrin repeat protein